LLEFFRQAPDESHRRDEGYERLAILLDQAVEA
jgi:hypothetical protein